MGIRETEALFKTKLDCSDPSVGGCIGGTLKGKVEACRDEEELRELLLVGATEGYSGKFEPGKLGAAVGRDVLKPEYCICCMDGGIERPGGGRSKDC